MIPYLVRRIPQVLLLLLGISTLLFFLLRLTGDPVLLLLGTEASYEQIAAARRSLGLDKPLPVQYVSFLARLLRLDFGSSIQTGQSAIDVVLDRFPATVEVAVVAVLITVVCGIPIGVFSALYRGHPGSGAIMTLAVVAQSAPTFWIGLMLMLVFGVSLRWLPTVGHGTVKHLVLPALTLSALPMARAARIARSAMLEVLSQQYLLTARAKGLTERRVILRHAVKNMLIPVVTVTGMDLGQLLGGAVIVETVFAWPGMGRQLYLAVAGRDYPVVQATVFVVTCVVVGINLIVDTTYFLLDPRVRAQ
ncbi:MAG: ABC transporter permease [bacterium]